MHDLDWLDNKLLCSGALRPALAPARWLEDLTLALAGQERLARTAGALDSFRHAPWRAVTNPLAVLGLAIGDATAQVPADAMAPGAQPDQAVPGRRPWPAPGAARGGLPPGSRQTAPAFGSPNPAHTDRTMPGAPGALDDRARPGTPTIPAPGAHQPPESGPTTIPTRQLAALAGEQTGTGDQAQRPGAVRMSDGTTSAQRDDRGISARYAGNGPRRPFDRSSAPAPNGLASPIRAADASRVPGAARPAGMAPADRSPASPARPAQAPHASAPRLPNLGQRVPDVARATLPDPALAGPALLARLTEPPPSTGANPPAGLPDLTRRAIDQAFRQTVHPGTLPAGRLAALAMRADHVERPRVPAPAYPAAAPGSDRGMPAPGPAGMALLRESVAAFSDAELRRDAAPAGPASALPLSSATPAERAPEHARPPDLLTPSGSAAEGIGLPAAVQNTFNVTVHMAGSPDHGEDELADRLTRILVEQARRHGIEI